MLNRAAGGRAHTRSESCGKGGAYEYIRGIYDNPYCRVISCCDSEFEK